MFILEITATNYRNVSCETVKFSQPCTFLVGENSLGKTNLLYLLLIIASRLPRRSTINCYTAPRKTATCQWGALGYSVPPHPR